jgi:serine/threonine-protein kinase
MTGSADTSEMLGALFGVALAAPLFAWGCGHPARKRARIVAFGPAAAEIDVTRAAVDTRRLARMARVVQVEGVVILAAGLLPPVWPAGLLFVPLGAAVVLAGTTWFRRRASRSAVRTRTGSWSRRMTALVMILVITVLGLVAIVGFMMIAAATQHPPDENLIPGDSTTPTWSTVNSVGSMLGLGGLVLAVVGYRAARRMARASASEAMAQDGRPLVLYLRSFADDGTRMPATANLRRPLLDTLSLRPTERFEEVVVGHLASLGPVVAVSDPNGPSRQLGAARIAMPRETDEWKPQVLAWLDEAQLVVVTAGTGEGLRWELLQVARHARGKALFLMPSGPAPLVRARGAHLLATLIDAGARLERAIDVDTTLVVVLDHDSTLRAIAGDRRDEACYQMAIDAGVRMMGRTAETATHTTHAAPRLADRVVVAAASALLLTPMLVLDTGVPSTAEATASAGQRAEQAESTTVQGGGTDPDTASASVDTAAVGDATGTPAVPPTTAESDPLARLEEIRQADQPVVESVVIDHWVPQISSKELDAVLPDGTVWDPADILADHRAWRERFPEVRLLRSDDYSTYRNGGFWITIVAIPFDSSEEAVSWCDGHALAAEDCYAKLISHTHPFEGSTRLRG